MEANLLNSLNKKPSALFLYFSRNSVQLYNPRIKTLEVEKLPQNILKDLDVLDKNALIGFFSSLLTNYKINVKNAVIVLSPSIYYEKVLEKTGEDQEAEMRSFLDTVPFDALRSKVYIQGATSRVIAINKNLCESLVSSLEQNNLGVEAVIPAGLIPPLAAKPSPDPESASYVLKNLSSLKLHTLTHTLGITEDVLSDEPRVTTPRNTRVYVLGGIFLVCILILVTLLISMPK